MTEKNSKTDIFDLGNKLVKSTHKSILGFFQFIFNIIKFSIDRYLLTSAFLLFSIILFATLHFARKDVYESEATIELRISNSSQIIPYINSLNNMASSDLSNLLKIKVDILSSLKEIDAFFFVDITGNNSPDLIDHDKNINYLDRNIKKIDDLIQLRVSTYDTNIIKHLNSKFLNLLETSHFQSLNESRLSSLNHMLHQTQREYQKLTEHQILKYSECLDTQGSVNINVSTDKFNEKSLSQNLFHDQILTLSRDIINYENEINHHQEAGEFTQSFFLPKRPKSFLISHLLVATGFFSIALLIAFFSSQKE